MNQIILVGRLSENLVLQKGKNGEDYANFKVACPRTFKNEEGIFETDFIPIFVKGVIASNTSNYCQKGDIIGVKGRIEAQEDKMQIIAERITILQSANEGER